VKFWPISVEIGLAGKLGVARWWIFSPVRSPVYLCLLGSPLEFYREANVHPVGHADRGCAVSSLFALAMRDAADLVHSARRQLATVTFRSSFRNVAVFVRDGGGIVGAVLENLGRRFLNGVFDCRGGFVGS